MRALNAAIVALALTSAAAASPAFQLVAVDIFPWQTPATATFDVVLMNPDATPYDIYSFQYALELPNSSTITFTDAEPYAAIGFYGPLYNYIYDAGNSAIRDLLGDSFYSYSLPLVIQDDFPNQHFVASDFELSGGTVTLAPGDSVSLGRYTVNIPAGQDEFTPTSLTFDPLFTNLTVDDGFGGMTVLLGNLSGADGGVTLFNAYIAVAPEPASLALFGLTCVGGGVVYAMRRRKAE